MVLEYKNFINKDIINSIKYIKTELTSAQEILDEVIESGKINEWQYGIIYSNFENFEHEYKNRLYRYYYDLESQGKDFSNINLLFNMNDYLYYFGKEKQLSLLKNRKDNVITIHLTVAELEEFTNIAHKTNEYIDVLNKYKVHERIHNWPKIVEEIYEKGSSL